MRIYVSSFVRARRVYIVSSGLTKDEAKGDTVLLILYFELNIKPSVIIIRSMKTIGIFF